jgi:hypothetical protein
MNIETQKQFKPQIVGFDHRLFSEAKRRWENLVDISSDLLAEMVSFLDAEDLETAKFMKLVSLDSKECIVQLFELSGAAKPGINTDRLIELGLITNDRADEIKRLLKRFSQAKTEAENIFKFDLGLLRDSDGLFSLLPVFLESLTRFCTTYTQSEFQNEALKQLKLITDGLNFFSRSGLIKTTYGTHGLTPLLLGITTNNDRSEFEPTKNLFQLIRWSNVFK